MIKPNLKNKILAGCLFALLGGFLVLVHEAESKGGLKKVVGGAVGGAAGKMVVSNSKASASPSSEVSQQSGPGAVPQPVVQKQVSTARYTPAQAVQVDFSTKRDPFKPFVTAKPEAPVGAKSLKSDASRLPLHSFDISQFRLIGVVADIKGNKAMVVDPAGKGYVLRVGMSIGKNEAKITRIETSGITAVEQFRDENGKVRKENIKIPLMRKP